MFSTSDANVSTVLSIASSAPSTYNSMLIEAKSQVGGSSSTVFSVDGRGTVLMTGIFFVHC
jgi:hypothetical protein